MEHHGVLGHILIFLTAAVVTVPISKKLGFGSVLGYLLAGITIGPQCLRLVTNVEDILHFSEFGVVLLLFLIGMELEPRKLWQLRMPIFGMGGMQVFASTVFLSSIGFLFGYSWKLSLLAAMGFALSSTAIALQILNEKKILNSASGRAAFSILLFQDIAVIPMIAVLPLLAGQGSEITGNLFLGLLRVVGIIAAVLFVSRIVLRRILSIIASTHLREIFTALALLLVAAMAALMQYLSVSMGLGAFLAGVLLADSEYRHALETDIEPFKGLLLGLFFISVGMSVDISLLLAHPVQIGLAVLFIFLAKFLAHTLLARSFKLPPSQAPFFSLILAQVGEFAFVLFGAAKGLGILSDADAGLLIAAAAVTMFCTPVLAKIFEKWIEPKLQKKKPREADAIMDEEAPVIIAGFGRVGQIVGRLLYSNGVKATVLDYEPDQIEILRRFGFQIYYGDATRVDLLEAAGAKKAKIIVNAIDEVESNIRLVDTVQKHFPHLKIISRVRNVAHLYELMDRKVHFLEREAFDSSLRIGRAVLEEMGMRPYAAQTAAQRFREFDLELLKKMHPERQNEKLRISIAKQAREDILRLFEEQEAQNRRRDEGWSVYDAPIT